MVSPEKLHEEVEAGRVALLLSRLLGEAQHLLSHLDGGQEDEKQKVDKDKATETSENNSQDEGENENRDKEKVKGKVWMCLNLRMATWQTLCSSGILRSNSPNLLGMSG